MSRFIAKASRSAWYWLAMLILGIGMESTALFYQHQLGYPPCTLCVHVRIYVLAFILVALFGLALGKQRTPRIIAHLLSLLLSFGLAERAWNLLGVERGFIESSCGIDDGLPAWLPPLDKWLPSVFEPWVPCGYTPELLFGVTMAEALIVLGAVAILTTITMSIYALKK